MVQATELSDALAATVVAAEYLSDPTISASTDWIFSQPTRRYYVAVDYRASTPADRLITNYDDNGLAAADYYRSKLTDGNTTTGNTVMGNSVNGGKAWQACAQLTAVKFWNRQDASPTWSCVIDPCAPIPAPSLCGAVSVIGINSPASPINAGVSRINVTPPGPVGSGGSYYPNVPLIDGWGSLWALNPLPLEGLNLGLPMRVTQFSKATSPAVSAGVSGTFGAAWKARVVRRGVFFVR
jgi:hypothetical protein